VLSRPTTDQVISCIANDLRDLVEPELRDGPAKVAVQMMQQMLRGAAVRAAHEIAWMDEEIAEISDVVASLPRISADEAVAAALAALAEADTASLQLEDVQRRYDLAGEVLAAAIEAGYAQSDQEAIDALRVVLQRRTDREMQIVGQFDLVGRG